MLQRIHHVLLQVFDFKGRPPSFHVTGVAAAELRQMIAQTTEFEAVAALLWVTEFTADKHPKPACWRVGLYDKWARGWGRIYTIAGVPFVFAQAQSPNLAGATLDFCDGRFNIIDPAVG